MEKIFYNFAEEITTKEELTSSLEEINQIEKDIFKKRINPLSKNAGKDQTKGLIKSLQKWKEKKLISENPEQQFSLLEELKEYLQKIPDIRIQLAFSPSANFLKKISFWLREETGKKIIIDVVLNPEIVGGMIIEYNGQYRNLSLAKKINEIIAKNLYE